MNEKDLIMKNVKKIKGVEPNLGGFIESQDKKRKKGQRLIRSIPPDNISTAKKPNIPIEGPGAE